MMGTKKKPDIKKIRPGALLQARIQGDLETAFFRFINAQRVPPSQADVIIVALTDFLKGEGFFPLPESQPLPYREDKTY